jgi:alpha-tubulin suppressor-like RCC1 family protein
MSRKRALLSSLVLVPIVGASLVAPHAASAYTPATTPTAHTISVGSEHSLLISGNGRIYGAGSNQFKQLGSTCAEPIKTFCELAPLPDGQRAVSVAVSTQSSYALSAGGTAYGMGYNDQGQVTGPDTYVSSWRKLAGQPTTVTSLSATFKTVAVTGSDGRAYLAGMNSCDLAGGDLTFSTLTPMVTANGQNIGARQVAVGDGGFCVVVGAHGKAYGIGDNSFGQITPNSGTLVWLNAPAAGVSIVAAAVGYKSTTTLGSDGNVYSIGDNFYRQLGDGTTTPANESDWAQMAGIGGRATSVAAGGYAAAVGMQGGSVYGVGDNSARSLTGTASVVVTPTPFGGPTISDPLVEVSLSEDGETSFVRDSTGVVFGAGYNGYYQLAAPGLSSSALVPGNGQVMTPSVAPSLSGTGTVGGALAADLGTWSVVPDRFDVQWLRDGVPIPGTSATTYAPTAADAGTQISAQVTGVRAGFAGAPAVTAAVSIPVVNQTQPSIAGTAVHGGKLTAKPGTWAGAGTYAFQWLRNGAAIPGATSATYALGANDAGTQISVQVTGAKAGVSGAPALSATTNIPAHNQTRPSITGSTATGHQLTAKAGTWYGAGYTYRVQWLRGGKPIAKATKSTYRVTAKDRHKKLSVRVTATKPGFATVAATSVAKKAK